MAIYFCIFSLVVLLTVLYTIGLRQQKRQLGREVQLQKEKAIGVNEFLLSPKRNTAPKLPYLPQSKKLSKGGIYYVGLPWLGGQRRHSPDQTEPDNPLFRATSDHRTKS